MNQLFSTWDLISTLLVKKQNLALQITKFRAEQILPKTDEEILDALLINPIRVLSETRTTSYEEFPGQQFPLKFKVRYKFTGDATLWKCYPQEFGTVSLRGQIDGDVLNIEFFCEMKNFEAHASGELKKIQKYLDSQETAIVRFNNEIREVAPPLLSQRRRDLEALQKLTKPPPVRRPPSS